MLEHNICFDIIPWFRLFGIPPEKAVPNYRETSSKDVTFFLTLTPPCLGICVIHTSSLLLSLTLHLPEKS